MAIFPVEPGATSEPLGSDPELRMAEHEEERVEVSEKTQDPLVSHVLDKFNQASMSRRGKELRWLTNYRDYIGKYVPTEQADTQARSTIFVRIPKTKTLAAVGQLNELLFSGTTFPITINPTEVPEGTPEFAHLDEGGQGQPQPDPIGYPGDGYENAFDRGLNAVKNMFNGANLIPGKAKDPKTPEIHPAKIQARKMEKRIQDQLTETDAAIELRNAIFEGALYGSIVVQGPLSTNRTLHRWQTDEYEDEDGNVNKDRRYAPVTEIVPKVKAPGIWNFYPDQNATSMKDAEFYIIRHRLSRADMRKLCKQPFFDVKAIQDIIIDGPNYVPQHWEHEIYQDQITESGPENERFEVYEFHGEIDYKTLENTSGKIEGLTEENDYLNMCIWVCGSRVIRATKNPYDAQDKGIYVCPYEVDPHSVFGNGIPENMSDSTAVMNGSTRAAIDNLLLSGNVMLDVDSTRLVPNQNLTLYPGKIFLSKGKDGKPAIRSIDIKSTTSENMSMFDRFRQIADEETGIPSYSHGQTGVQSTTRTAAGMSMLMGASALNIKQVAKNMDDFLLKPLGEAMYHWNMQFSDDIDIQGDVEVKAMGASGILQREVKSQRLLQFMQVIASNPNTAPWAKLDNIIKEIAISMELDPDYVVNDLTEAKIFASVMQQMNPQQVGTASQPGTGAPQGPADGNVAGGTAAPQDVSMPGEGGFSGKPTVQ